MYKIYHNEKLVYLMHEAYDSHLPENDITNLKLHYGGKPKFIINYLNKLSKNPELATLYILSNNVEKLREDFFSLFKIVEASGGLVLNDKSQILMIYRKGFWDLPKGKIEDNETKSITALREVKEETGLKKLRIIDKLPTTYHTYRGKSGRKILKPSHWYVMYSTYTDKLKPQTNEQIELAEWKEIDRNLLEEIFPIYPSIADTLRNFFFTQPEKKLQFG